MRIRRERKLRKKSNKWKYIYKSLIKPENHYEIQKRHKQRRGQIIGEQTIVQIQFFVALVYVTSSKSVPEGMHIIRRQIICAVTVTVQGEISIQSNLKAIGVYNIM
jgi:hypothetical protein